MDFNKKEMPIQGFAGFGGGATSAAFRSSASKTYVDDVFSTYVYEGDGTTNHQIVNGIDLATHGGFIWGKERGNTGSHYQFDTERGLSKRLKSNSDAGEETDTFYSSVNSNGYTINKTTSVNVDGNDYVSWSFRKSAGFFDVITYTGNGSNRTISHNLECIPGCIMIKRTDATADWCVWHRRLGIQGRNTGEYGIFLNEPDDKDSDSGYWNNTNPTASVFSVGTSSLTNHNGGTYVAYIFGHGDSSGFCMNASNGNIKINDDSDLDLGTSNSVYECWFKCTTLDGLSGSGYNCIFDTRGGTGTNTTGYAVFLDSNGILGVYHNGWHCKTGSTITCSINTWYHVAVIKSSTTVTLWVNGVQSGDSGTVASNLSNDSIMLGCGASTADRLAGKISNFRVSDTAIYNASYNWVLPEFPLCSQKNTVLLCCDRANVLSGTVVPSSGISQVHVLTDATSEFLTGEDTIGSVTAGNVYGADEYQNIIKCGGYAGNGSSTAGPIINCGWEPAFIWIKNISSSGSYWRMVDVMRGIMFKEAATYSIDKTLYPDLNMAEESVEICRVNANGFEIRTNQNYTNKNGDDFIYMAVRRPDGYAGKPPTAATDVFNITAGLNSVPGFVAGFPVDWAMSRDPSSGGAMYTGARGQGEYALGTHDNSPEFATTSRVFDFPTGWNVSRGANSPEYAWMWKRHKGFDVQFYTGNGTAGRRIEHSLNAAPEMIWTKKRSSGNSNWMVWHEGLNNGGANAATWYLVLNENTAQTANSDIYGSTSAILPTSTDWTLGSNAGVNENGSDFIAMLFASVSGISSVGYYDGVDGEQTITTGFQPRFVIIKRISDADHWFVLDTTRGWGSGNDEALELDTTDAQSSVQAGAPTSTGFTVPALSGNDFAYGINGNGYKFVYYAHA